MAEKICPQCNSSLPEEAAFCSYCGYSFQVKENPVNLESELNDTSDNNEDENQEEEIKVTFGTTSNSNNQQKNTPTPTPMEKQQSGYTGRVSKMSVWAFVLSLLGITGVVGLVLGIVDLIQFDGRKKGLSIAAVIIGGTMSISILCGVIAGITSPSTTTTSTTTTTSEKTSENTEIVSEVASVVESEEKTEAVEEPSVPTETEEEFKASCQEASYKTLARNPEEHVGDRIVVTVQINQIIQGGLFTKEMYRVLTGTDFGYYGDEYVMFDTRYDKSMKLLNDDIIIIYGEFAGCEKVTRAVSRTSEDVPAINAYYIELVNEDE